MPGARGHTGIVSIVVSLSEVSNMQNVCLNVSEMVLVDPQEPAKPWFVEDGARYFTVLPRLVSSSNSNWRHVALVTAPVIHHHGLNVYTKIITERY